MNKHQRRRQENSSYNQEHAGKLCKQRYQTHVMNGWKGKLKVGQKPPDSPFQVSKSWSQEEGGLAKARAAIQALEGGEWVPGTDLGVVGWRVQWEPARFDVRPISPEGEIQYRRRGEIPDETPDVVARVMGFEEAVQMSADFAARFGDDD